MRSFLLTLTMMLVFAVGAQAEDAPVRFDIFTQGYGKAEVDNRGGEFSVVNTNIMAGYKWFTFNYSRSEYDWEHSSALPFGKKQGEPWKTLHNLAFDAKTGGQLTDTVGWFAGGTLTSGFESEIANSFSLGGRGGLTWEVNEDFRIRAGGIGLLSPAHAMLLPLIGLDWRNELDAGFSATIGAPLTALRYRLNPVVSTRLSSYWSRSLYRLANDSSVSKEGYLEDSGLTTGAYVDITPLDGLKLTVGAEVLSERYIRLFDDNGDRLSKYRVDSSLGGVLRLKYSF